MRTCVLAAALVVTLVAVVGAKLELSIEGCRVLANYTGSRRLRWVTFFMSIDRRVTFSKAQYKFRLKCHRVDKGKVCSGLGGPCLEPGQDVYYALKVKFARRRIVRIKPKKPWVSPITTTSPTTTTIIISTTSPQLPSSPGPGMTVSCGKICELDLTTMRCGNASAFC